MALILPLEKVTPEDRGRVGGKHYALSVTGRNGMKVPEASCVCAEADEAFVSWNGLRKRILMELNRKAGNVWTTGPVDDPPGRRI